MKEQDNIRLQLLKKFGANAVITGRDMERASFGRISTGSISLDLAIGGGIPIGRMVQIAGAKSSTKSTLCDYIIKNAQNTQVEWCWVERKEVKGREVVEEHRRAIDKLVCGYLDVEGTKTVSWSRDVIGVDTESWVFSQPAGLEETLNMAHEMQKLGVHFIVLDSVDALQSLKEFEAEAGESTQMGIKPKAMGEYCRKFTATNNKLVREGKLPCTVVLINQVREKIGSYGCLHSSTLVNFVDGRSIPIGKVVKEKIEGEVWSYNEKTHKIEPRRILNWHYNGRVKDNKDYLTIRSYCPQNKNGIASITVTPNHKVLTLEGWKEARDLTLEDTLISRDVTKLDGTIKDSSRGVDVSRGVPVSVLSIEISSNKKMKSKGKYDLSIEGNENYLVGGKHNGVIVHNSPDFTPGGKAIDFYISLDLRLKRGDWITIGKGDNKEIVGQVVKFKSLKNKTYKQQQDGSYDFYFENSDVCKQGQIDNFKEVIIEGAQWGIIERAGAWFKFNGENLAQGMDNTVDYLRENLDIFLQIKEALFSKVAEEESKLFGDKNEPKDTPLKEGKTDKKTTKKGKAKK